MFEYFLKKILKCKKCKNELILNNLNRNGLIKHIIYSNIVTCCLCWGEGVDRQFIHTIK